jgi:taspase (threonine aspartase 1)
LACVVVHTGAGFCHPSNEYLYRKCCKSACLLGWRLILDKNAQSSEVVKEVIACLEDTKYLNAGTGSNLNMSGHVECDASIMEGKSGAFGAVGCLPGVKNPICVAYDLMLEERKGLLNFGLIPPMSIAESLI